MDASNDTFNKVTWIIAFSFGGIMFIYMVVNTVIFWCMRNTKDVCYKMNTIAYSALFLALGIAETVLVSINFAYLSDKFKQLIAWSHYAGCVDDYMKVTDYQVSYIEDA